MYTSEQAALCLSLLDFAVQVCECASICCRQGAQSLNHSLASQQCKEKCHACLLFRNNSCSVMNAEALAALVSAPKELWARTPLAGLLVRWLLLLRPVLPGVGLMTASRPIELLGRMGK
jgi:hypothetical protein